MNTSTIQTTSPDVATTLVLSAARRLRDSLATLLRAERTAAAEFLLALADFDRRRAWEPLGHASLFAFLHVELGLSKGGAFFRQTAARLLQRFPDLIEPLRDGRLCVTTVVELAKVLTEANRAEVLPRFFGCSSKEAREIVAELVPAVSPPVRAVVTAVAAPRVIPTERVVEVAAHAELRALPEPRDAVTESVQSTEPILTHPTRVHGHRDDVEPLTADLRRLHVTVSRGFLEKVARARDGLSHMLPGATTEQVLEAALDLLLEKQARVRGQVKKPRTSLPIAATPVTDPSLQVAPPLALVPTETTPPRRIGPRESIPAAVRRAVWERDASRCAWPLDAGGRCGSTHRLELDHIVPWAKLGDSTFDNLRVVCATHNRLAARQAFGDRHMSRYVGARRASKDSATSGAGAGEGSGR